MPGHQKMLDLIFDEEQVVILPGRLYPVLAIDLQQTIRGWMSSLVCHLDHGGCEIWRGPYPTRMSAVRNAACFGRDFLRARGLSKMVDAITAHFQLPSRRGESL